jgi:hypothetical protein
MTATAIIPVESAGPNAEQPETGLAATASLPRLHWVFAPMTDHLAISIIT